MTSDEDKGTKGKIRIGVDDKSKVRPDEAVILPSGHIFQPLEDNTITGQIKTVVGDDVQEDEPIELSGDMRIKSKVNRDDEPTNVQIPAGIRGTYNPDNLVPLIGESFHDKKLVSSIEDICSEYKIELKRKAEDKPIIGRIYRDETPVMIMGIAPRPEGYNFIMSDSSTSLALRLKKENGIYSLTIAYDSPQVEAEKVSEAIISKINETKDSGTRLLLRYMNNAVKKIMPSDEPRHSATKDKLGASTIETAPHVFKLVLDAVAETYQK